MIAVAGFLGVVAMVLAGLATLGLIVAIIICLIAATALLTDGFEGVEDRMLPRMLKQAAVFTGLALAASVVCGLAAHLIGRLA